MKAIEFEGQTGSLQPPIGSKRGECGELPFFRNNGNKTFVTVWKPSPEDLNSLNEGAHVLLHVWGANHPPVAMSVQKMIELP